MVNKNGWATVCEIKAKCDLLTINIQTWLKGFVFNRELQTYQHTFTLESYKSNQGSTTTITLLLWGGPFTLLTEIYSLEINQEANASDNRDTLQQQTQQQTAAASTKRKQQNVTEEKIPSKKSKTKPRNNASANQNTTDDKKHACLQRNILLRSLICFSIHFQTLPFNETEREHSLRVKRNKNKIAATEKKFHISAEELPAPPPSSADGHFNKVMDCMRAFEIEQMAYEFRLCTICHERRLDMTVASLDICSRCNTTKVL